MVTTAATGHLHMIGGAIGSPSQFDCRDPERDEIVAAPVTCPSRHNFRVHAPAINDLFSFRPVFVLLSLIGMLHDA